MKNIQHNLANNIIDLRQKKNWSQQQLSEASEIPRTTITHLETGSANPSLQNLVKLSSALQVGIEELLATPRKDCQLIKAQDITLAKKKTGDASLYKLLPDKIRGMEIDKLVMESGQYMTGSPHIIGTKEYFYCLQGSIEITTQGEKFIVNKGDILAFPGDSRHFYKNIATGRASGISIVIPMPTSHV